MKRGRPTVKGRLIKIYGAETACEMLGISTLFTDGASDRSATNAMYELQGQLLLLEYNIPYQEEIRDKQCITEQLGRVLYRFDPESAAQIARAAAAAYHVGYTAKHTAEWIRDIRKTGTLDDGFLVAATKNGLCSYEQRRGRNEIQGKS